MRMRRLLDRARKIDARNHWKTPYDWRPAGEGKPVLVIQRRPFHPYCDVAIHQVRFVELGERGNGALVRLVNPDRLERRQCRSPRVVWW
jgi:hypothetical protein